MRLRYFALVLAAFSICGSNCALGKDRPFPPQILAAKTVAVIAHYGFVPSAFNPGKGDKFRRDAEGILLDSGRFTVLDDPDKSDLVLLLVCGYSPGWLGFRDHIVIGAIFLGGTQQPTQQPWSPIPLWISEHGPTLRTRSAPAALAKEFLKQVAKAELHGAGPPGTDNEKRPEETNPPDNEKEEAAPSSESPDLAWLRPEILQAKKVIVLLRTDETVGPQGEQREKSIEKELKKWGRFTIVDNPADADLIFVCVRYLDFGRTNPPTYENLLIFRGDVKNPDCSNMPLWMAMQIETLFGPSPGTQMVRWVRKQIEAREARSSQPAPAKPPL
jgi:hypothetical protein